ncbi:MAG: MarC family protein [Spirochaetales bacterium]|nr:MarC family protein [Spirochaetales bacterium]
MGFEFFLSTFIKMFFLFTPFFALSMFLAMTEDYTSKQKILLVFKIVISVSITCVVLMFAGKGIFKVFGITVDAFRIGAGALLFLSAVDLVRGTRVVTEKSENNDIAVVPLTIPVIVGPATIGTLIVMGSELETPGSVILALIALGCAILVLGIFLLLSPWIKKGLGKKGLSVLSKLTGLILAALSAQMIFTGVLGFLS